MRRWIFIRGLSRGHQHWHHLPSVFRQIFPDDQIEMPDVRGNGDLIHSPSYASIADNVRDLRSRSELLKQGPVYLLTISLGSMIGITWAELYPQDIAGLVVINTSAANLNPFYQRLQLKNWPLFLDALKAGHDPLKKEKAVMKFVAQNLKDADAVAEEFAKIPMTSRSNTFRQIWAASHFKVPNKASVPTLILSSHGDKMVSPKCSVALGKKWNLPVIFHPSGGHELTIEEPQWVVDQIKNHNFS